MRRFVLAIAIFAQGTPTPCFATEVLGAIGPLDDKPCRIAEPAKRDSIEALARSLGPEEIRRARTLCACLGEDSVRVAKQIVHGWLLRISRPPSPSRPLANPFLPKSASWSEEEMLRYLSGEYPYLREDAIGEVARRRNKSGLAIIRERLETNRGPGGEEIRLTEAFEMIDAEGQARDTAAVPQLMQYAKIPHPGVRMHVYQALESIGDRRALGVLRPALLGPCEDQGGIDASWQLVDAIATLGEQDDALELVRRAKECPHGRWRAISAAGAIGGPEVAYRAIDDLWGSSPNLYGIFYYYYEIRDDLRAMVWTRENSHRNPR